jgi:hypothetical protein
MPQLRHHGWTGDSLRQCWRVEAVLADWRTAPIDERMQAALGFLEALTLQPQQTDRNALVSLRAAGVSDQGIHDLIYVRFVFSVIDRLADALDFDLPVAEGEVWCPWLANWIGYRFS